MSNQKIMSDEDYTLVQQDTKYLNDTIDNDKCNDFDRIMDSTF
jgi:hypothetical protein